MTIWNFDCGDDDPMKALNPAGLSTSTTDVYHIGAIKAADDVTPPSFYWAPIACFIIMNISISTNIANEISD